MHLQLKTLFSMGLQIPVDKTHVGLQRSISTRDGSNKDELMQ